MFIQMPFIRGIRKISQVLQRRNTHFVDDESKFDIQIAPTTPLTPKNMRGNSAWMASLAVSSGSRQMQKRKSANDWKIDATRTNLG